MKQQINFPENDQMLWKPCIATGKANYPGKKRETILRK